MQACSSNAILRQLNRLLLIGLLTVLVATNIASVFWQHSTFVIDMLDPSSATRLNLTASQLSSFSTIASSGNDRKSSKDAVIAEHTLVFQNEPKRPRLNSSTIASMNIKAMIPDSIEVFYSGTRGDRSGAVILDMLMGHAFAWTLGRRYAGMCGPEYPHSKDHRRMIKVLGLEDELPYPEQLERCNHTTTAIKLTHDVYMFWKDLNIFDPAWMDYIQKRRKLPPKTASSGKSTYTSAYLKFERIIIHIRRGDVTPCKDEYVRYTPNSHYFHLVNDIARDNNDTFYNVTVHSELDAFEGWQTFNFSHLPNVACYLSLDNDAAGVWSDMLGYNDDPSTRRILVLSPSTFSLVPAVLADQSTTTVIYTPFWHGPLRHWRVVDSNKTRAAATETKRLREKYCNTSNTANEAIPKRD